MSGTFGPFAYPRFDERWSAYQIDGLIIGVPFLLVFFRFLFDADLDVFALGGVWALTWHAYFGGFWWLGHGQTPGMRVRKIRVIRREGGDPGFGRSVLRIAALFFGSFFWIVPISVLVDHDGIGVHDRLAGTRVVRIGQRDSQT